jgi:TBCC domain-containing protein 1
MNEVRLWPNRKIFEYGIVYSHPKITFTNAERIIKYSLTKENWPMLSWKVWRHMACEKLKIKEELAWVYFETFDSFQV